MPKVSDPPEIYFAGQREDETIEFILFKHWYTLALPIVKAFAIIFLSLALPIWLGFMKFIFSYGLLAFVYYIWQVFWVISILYAYVRWYQDRYIITDERIINIDQSGMFKRRVSEVELTRIQNVTHEVNGFFRTLFNFGTVVVESASSSEMVLKDVGDPASVQEEITRMVRAGGRSREDLDS